MTTMMNPSSCLLRSSVAAAAIVAAACLVPTGSGAAEPAACLSSSPADWPQTSKPYFMIAADTSGSMTTIVTDALGQPIVSSCGFGTDRLAHLRCAIQNTIKAFSGQVHFGLATFPVNQQNCTSSCYTGCTYADYPNNQTYGGCGPGTGANRRGAFIRVPMLQDAFWQVPPPADNTATLLSWADNNCTGSSELFAMGSTPLNGMLRDLKRYFASSWLAQDNSVSYPTPLSASDLPGSGTNGSTACRPVSILFVTDGDEVCDTPADAVAAATDLYATGVTVGGRNWKIPTYMINFSGGTSTNADAIAAAGGTGASVRADNEDALTLALSSTIAKSIAPEGCDNTDNNCNGCTDEGSTHYANIAQTCCTWTTSAQRATCLGQYTATITQADPDGDLTKLPCTTAAQATTPTTWLCYNPGETCDSIDNNAYGGIDEGISKCGNPQHCPTTEVCNATDDDCDGLTDEGNVCSGCTATPEICDGCDNDCDGMADDGVAAAGCGTASPPNCAGTMNCSAAQAVPAGTCATGGWQQCANSPQPEVCDGLDNDCDGAVDDNVAPVPCVPAGTPPGLVYGGSSQCVMGTTTCMSGQLVCQGFAGPTSEVCDGIDNTCDGLVDNGFAGAGQPCGPTAAPCSPGVTTCVNGQLVCQGGVQPQGEVCDGIDNDCNGAIDDPPLADQPPAGTVGCWALPGSCCTHASLQWCPPAGATCSDMGTLARPCSRGTLTCAGAAGWACAGSRVPAAETCDGLDNDCDGAADDDADLCPPGKSCLDAGCR